MNQSNSENLIRAIVLQNAIQHNGKAVSGAILGKFLSIKPDEKKNISQISIKISVLTKEINSLSLDQQLNQFKSFQSYLPIDNPKQQKIEKPLKLKNAEHGKVITRFSPNPNFILHLGSARAAILSHDYAKAYNGKFILRFEDTDPKTKKPQLEYYENVRNDLNWLDCTPNEEYIQSKRLEIYYDVARSLINQGNAYICECSQDMFKSLLIKCESCPDRPLSPDINIKRLQKMLDGEYSEGNAVLRIRADLNHPNPAVRDWPAMRIINTDNHPHPLVKNKFKVWPLYNFSCSIDDHLLGITHIIRGVEHITNGIKQRQIYEYMKWTYPTEIHYGRVSLEKNILSKSDILEGIETKKFQGYDDPRLGTLVALRKRGFQSNTLRNLIHNVGIHPSKAQIEWSNLEAMNRKIIDPISNRRFVILSPYKLTIEGLKDVKSVILPLHPEQPIRGNRKIEIKENNGKIIVYVDKNDLMKVGVGGSLRLKGFINIQIKSINESSSANFEGYDLNNALKSKYPIIHWLPYNSFCNVKILWDDATSIKCIGESGLESEKIDNLIQMERIGFARIDEKKKDLISIVYSHQ